MSFELIILGSSSALPTSKRSTAAHLLNMNERFFLIDCGEGTQIQLRRNKLSPARINHIFISHLHGDHVFGLFGLISSLGLMGRKADLHLYGPQELEELVKMHLGFFGALSFELRFHTVQDGHVIYEDSKIKVTGIALQHRIETYGYLFAEKPRPLNVEKDKILEYGLGVEDIRKIKQGKDHIAIDGRVIPNSELTKPPYSPRSYAYISDTSYAPKIAEKIKHVDLLFHETTFLEEDKALAKQTFHSTAKEAAMIAKAAQADKLLIGHFSTRYKDERRFINEAREVFPDTWSVDDGNRYSVELRRRNNLD